MVNNINIVKKDFKIEVKLMYVYFLLALYLIVSDTSVNNQINYENALKTLHFRMR